MAIIENAKDVKNAIDNSGGVHTMGETSIWSEYVVTDCSGDETIFDYFYNFLRYWNDLPNVCPMSEDNKSKFINGDTIKEEEYKVYYRYVVKYEGGKSSVHTDFSSAYKEYVDRSFAFRMSIDLIPG